MAHALLILLLLLAPPARPTVFFCQGSASFAYHRTATCEGLAWCTRPVKSLPQAAAVKLGRRPCGRCCAGWQPGK